MKQSETKQDVISNPASQVVTSRWRWLHFLSGIRSLAKVIYMSLSSLSYISVSLGDPNSSGQPCCSDWKHTDWMNVDVRMYWRPSGILSEWLWGFWSDWNLWVLLQNLLSIHNFTLTSVDGLKFKTSMETAAVFSVNKNQRSRARWLRPVTSVPGRSKIRSSRLSPDTQRVWGLGNVRTCFKATVTNKKFQIHHMFSSWGLMVTNLWYEDKTALALLVACFSLTAEGWTQ